MGKPENVTCPVCEGPMVSRKSQYGVFWGCRRYPDCKGTRDVNGEPRRRPAVQAAEDPEPLAPSARALQHDRRRWESS